MKIECIAHREGGSKIDIDGIEYHFEPLEDGAHVADVEEVKHQDRFLSLGEGFKLYRGELAPVGSPTRISLPVVNDKGDLRNQDTTIARMLHGSSVHESTYEIGGKTVQLGEVVAKAFASSGLTAEEWNTLDEADRHAKIDITLDDMADAAPEESDTSQFNAEDGEALKSDAPSEASDERAVLAEAYKAKFGKAPHYRASVETIKTALAE